jgi:hypothetical protein
MEGQRPNRMSVLYLLSLEGLYKEGATRATADRV